MNPRLPIAALVIFSLAVLALCCQVLSFAHIHDAMESAGIPMAHLSLLAMSLPAQFVSLVILVVLAATAAVSALPRLRAVARRRLLLKLPDEVFDTPLHLALVGGILNPKAF